MLGARQYQGRKGLLSVFKGNRTNARPKSEKHYPLSHGWQFIDQSAPKEIVETGKYTLTKGWQPQKELSPKKVEAPVDAPVNLAFNKMFDQVEFSLDEDLEEFQRLLRDPTIQANKELARRVSDLIQELKKARKKTQESNIQEHVSLEQMSEWSEILKISETLKQDLEAVREMRDF